MKPTICVLGISALAITGAALANGQNTGGNNGYEIVRIPTSTSPKCINSKKDEVTLSAYRVIMEKKGGFLTSDKSAGIAVLATLNGTSIQLDTQGGNSQPVPGATPQQVNATTPQVSVLPISSEVNGQVFVPLEYQIASNFLLSQSNSKTKTETTSMQLKIYAEKPRDKNTFGTIVTDASSILKALPIPANPYLTVANTFLDFANKTIQDDASNSKNAVLFATVTIPFADRDYSDIATCESHNDSYTGAIAVIAATGVVGSHLITLGNLSQRYCWRYNSHNTYEVQYADKPSSGCSGLGNSQWNEISNDYTMLLLSAENVPATPVGGQNAGLVQETPPRIDFSNSRKICDSLKVNLKLCGVPGDRR